MIDGKIVELSRCRRFSLLEVGSRRQDSWHCSYQPLRIFMLRVSEDLIGRSGLDDLALVKDSDAIANSRYRGKIMRNVKDGHPSGAVQLPEESENFGLRNHIERAGGFVGNEQRGTMHDRHSNQHALRLPDAHLQRVFAQELIVGGQGNALHGGSDRVRTVCAGARSMSPPRFFELSSNLECWIQRRKRTL